MINNELLNKIKVLAVSDNWGEREDAAVMIKEINDSSFEEYIPIWKKWVKNPKPGIRRAVEVGLLRINKKNVKESLDLLELLLYDSDSYVRKNCGPFALSHVCYKNPGLGFKRIREWIKDKDINLRWNIAMCLGAWFGQTHPKESLKILKRLGNDERRFVWRAVASSLIKLIRKYPEYKKKVYSWNINHVITVVKKYVDDLISFSS